MSTGYQDFLSSPVFTSRGYLDYKATSTVVTNDGIYTNVLSILNPAIINRMRITFSGGQAAGYMFVQAGFDSVSFDAISLGALNPSLVNITNIQPYEVIAWDDEYYNYMIELKEELTIRESFNMYVKYTGTGYITIAASVIYYPVKAV